MTSNKKTIGFLCSSSSLGGLEMNTVKLAHWMRERGWPVRVYLVKGSRLDRMASSYDLPISYIRKHRKYYDFAAAIKLHKQLKKESISYLWFRDNHDMSLAATISSLSSRKIKVIYQQAMQLGVIKKDIFHTIRYSRIDAWVALLPKMARQVQQQTEFDSFKLHVIPLGMEMDRFAKNFLSMEDARWKLELPKDKFIVGVIGRIDPKKGQETLIEALNLLINENIHVALIGDTTENEGKEYLLKLQQLIKEYKLEEKVHFVPHQKEVETAYKALNVFVLTSHSETFGTTTIEAMASGTPVIATKSGGTPEIIADNKTGLLFPPKNEKLLAEKISLLYNDSELRYELRRAAQFDVIGRFSHLEICKQIEGLLKTL